MAGRLYAIFHIARERVSDELIRQPFNRSKNCFFACCIIELWISSALNIEETKGVSWFRKILSNF